MIFKPTPLEGVFLIELEKRTDNRGDVARILRPEEYHCAGVESSLARVDAPHCECGGRYDGLALNIARPLGRPAASDRDRQPPFGPDRSVTL